MTIAADQLDDTPSPTDLQQFVYLANSVVELLETAKRELEHDREATKALLVTAIERRSRTKGVRPRRISRLADGARPRFHRRESASHYPRQGPQRCSAAKHGTFLAVLQTSLRRTTARLRREETAGEGVPSADYQLAIPRRNSPKRRLFQSNTSVQAPQAGFWSKPIQLEARP